MSHFTKLEVDYKQQYEPQLLMAIEEILKTPPEVHEHPVELYNYWGDTSSNGDEKNGMRAEKCEIVVRRDKGVLKGKPTNDCGWKRTEDGKYNAYLDKTGINDAQQGLISQAYAAAVAEKQFKAQGYMTQRKQLEDGRIQVVATRY